MECDNCESEFEQNVIQDSVTENYTEMIIWSLIHCSLTFESQIITHESNCIYQIYV